MKYFFILFFSISVFAYTDSELSTIRDQFDGRRDQFISRQIANPYPALNGNDSDLQNYTWHYLNYALAAFYRNVDNAGANDAVITAATNDLAHQTELNGEFGLHWTACQYARIYQLFSSSSSYFPGRLSADAQQAICEVMWTWAKQNSIAADASVDKVWNIWGSENHDAMKKQACWATAKILKDEPAYMNNTYDDGTSPAYQYQLWDEFLKEYSREKIKKGLFIETFATGYAKYTLQCFYNYYDFGSDELSELAGSVLDLFWADWSEKQIDFVCGSAKSRVYQGAQAMYAKDDNFYSFSWYYFGTGIFNNPHPVFSTIVTSNYRLPLVVMDIALDTAGRGVYECKVRRPGLNELPKPASVGDDTYAVEPYESDLLHYTYCTPGFIMSSAVLPKRPLGDWAQISSQNRWQSIVFSGGPDSRLFPQCQSVPTTYLKTYNQYWSVQHLSTSIVQRLDAPLYSYTAGDMRVYFADDLNVVEEDYWIFVEAADAYAAVRVVQGGYSWDDANWIRCSQLDTPVIFDAALKSDFADFEAFKTSIRSRSLSVRGGVLYYKCIDGSEIQLYLEGEFTPAIDSQLVNYNPVKVFDSPFITSDWNSGVVEISKDDRQLVINLQDCGTPSKADINGDCVVDLLDIFEIAQSWGKCSVPYAQECDNPYLN